MKTFFADRTERFKKRSYILPNIARVRIRYPAGTDCAVVAVDDKGNETSLALIQCPSELVEHYMLHGYKSLELVAKKDMIADVTVREKQAEEPHNDEPVPARPQADNVLQRIRQTVQQQMGVQREAFLENRTGLRGYELPDDAPDDFEEELMAKVDRAQAENEAKAKAQSNDTISGSVDSGSTGNTDSSVSGSQPVPASDATGDK